MDILYVIPFSKQLVLSFNLVLFFFISYILNLDVIYLSPFECLDYVLLGSPLLQEIELFSYIVSWFSLT